MLKDMLMHGRSERRRGGHGGVAWWLGIVWYMMKSCMMMVSDAGHCLRDARESCC
jgi:hypothetical protein